jgi:hypothetical protein
MTRRLPASLLRAILVLARLGLSADQLLAQQQPTCPADSEFNAVTQTRPVSITSRSVDVWDAVRKALRWWQDSAFLQGTDRLDAPRSLILERSPTAQRQQVPPVPDRGYTCYFQKRRDGRTDFRIAFWFSLYADQRGRVLEIRWLGKRKGAGERTWQSDLDAPGVAETLAQRIEVESRH